LAISSLLNVRPAMPHACAIQDCSSQVKCNHALQLLIAGDKPPAIELCNDRAVFRVNEELTTADAKSWDAESWDD
jgi:hypothetical protein